MNITNIIKIFAVVILFLLLGCNDNSTEPQENDYDSLVVVRKPNLYIYPIEKINLRIKLKFPLGGELQESEPRYNDGWQISVAPDGIINNDYHYLFYEYLVPDYFQREKGWIITVNSLKEFFEENMSSAGFNYIEIQDFIDYWIPILVDYPYYAIYPQFRNNLDKVNQIIFSVEPDNFYRLQYLIESMNYNNLKLEEPDLEISERNGFYAMEWGVILD